MYLFKKEDSLNEILKTNKITGVLFSAKWCSPCNLFINEINKLSSELDKILFIELDLDKFPSIAKENKIITIPTLIFFKNNSEIFRFEGYKKYELIKKKIGGITI